MFDNGHLFQIRRVACDQLYTLSQTDTSAHPDVQKPNQFLLSVVLGAQLPLWSPTSIMRGINQRSVTCVFVEEADLTHFEMSSTVEALRKKGLALGKCWK